MIDQCTSRTWGKTTSTTGDLEQEMRVSSLVSALLAPAGRLGVRWVITTPGSGTRETQLLEPGGLHC